MQATIPDQANDNASPAAGVPPISADPGAALGYLRELYGTADTGFLSFVEFHDSGGVKGVNWRSVSDLDSAARYITSRAHAGQTLYLGMGLRSVPLPHNRRGGGDDVCGIPALWGDVDYADSIAHKRADLPADADAALAIIRTALPVPPSLIVDSGYGFYPLLVFREFWSFADAAERAHAAALLARYYRALHAKAAGAHIDGAVDLARVLKTPGAINWKNRKEPRPVRIVHDSGLRFTIDELDEMLPELTEGREGVPPYTGARGRLLRSELEDAVAIFTPWHRDGARHVSGLHVAGACAVAGFEEADTTEIVRRLSVGDHNPRDRQKAVADTYARLRTGKRVSGYYGLRDAVGMDEESLRRWGRLRERFRQRTEVRIVLGRLRVRHARLRVREAGHA